MAPVLWCASDCKMLVHDSCRHGALLPCVPRRPIADTAIAHRNKKDSMRYRLVDLVGQLC